MAQMRNKKLLQKIAVVVKELRTNEDISQEDFYNDTNIHIGRIETSKVNVTVSTLSAICKYFKISLSEFHKKVESVK
jgi:transcriptional regulator with XRE-family HTH domain